VRITVVGRDVVSCVAIESPGDALVDYRDTAAWLRGEVKLNPYVVPPHVLAMSVRAAELCHHVLSGLDWKHDEARDHWELLEANSAPVTVGIDLQTNSGIAVAVMRWLERAVEERARS
jgi:glutathione synthase/RimK-type ligase-like ATP-grasp enzyme